MSDQVTKEEWEEWKAHPTTGRFVELLGQLEKEALRALSGCETANQYFLKDGYYIAIGDIVEQISLLGKEDSYESSGRPGASTR